jgi:hypothetical protein
VVKKTVKKTAVAAKPMAWSYSRWVDYERCPQAFKFKVIEKRPEPSNPYMERGQAVHEQLQLTLLKPRTKVPQDLARVETEIKMLRKFKAEPEAMLTFTDGFRSKTGWFDKSAWCRVKVDATARVTYEEALTSVAPEQVVDGKGGQLSKLTPGRWVVDWKTGQFKPERSQDQVDLYALAAFLDDPAAEFVIVSLAFVDFGRTVHAYFDDRGQVERMRTKWVKRVAPLQADVKFKPKVGVHCQWCFFSKRKGGPCPAA